MLQQRSSLHHAAPVATVADVLHLVDDAAAVLFIPLPDVRFELLVAEVGFVDAAVEMPAWPVPGRYGGSPTSHR